MSSGGGVAAPEQGGVQRAHQDDVGIFAQPVEREGHRRIFGLIARDELALRLCQVERRALRLGQRRDENTTAIGKSSGLGRNEPLTQPKHRALLRLDDARRH